MLLARDSGCRETAIFLAILTSTDFDFVLTVVLEIGFLVVMVTDVAAGDAVVVSLDTGDFPPWQMTWLSDRTEEVTVEMACFVVTAMVVVTTMGDG